MKYKIIEELLVGTWVGGADDGSGLRTMIYNYGITLHNDGTGVSFSWNKEQDGLQESEDKIEWMLSDDNMIGIRYTDSADDSSDWENIKIEISDFIGAYNSRHYKIIEEGKDSFWAFPEPLYKSKLEEKRKGFVSRILTKIIG